MFSVSPDFRGPFGLRPPCPGVRVSAMGSIFSRTVNHHQYCFNSRRIQRCPPLADRLAVALNATTNRNY
jgi:hypothetical protein